MITTSASMTIPFWPICVATTILLVGVADDLRSRKFHNWLFLVCTALGFAASGIFNGWGSLPHAAIAFLVGVAVMLPMVLLRIIGAGDMKLLAAFGTATADWRIVVSVALLALFWGALFGFVQVLVKRQGRELAHNLAHIVLSQNQALNKAATGSPTQENGQTKGHGLELHKIPYTFALLLGWLSHVSAGGLL